MKIKEIQEIINFIKKSDLDDVSIETENIKIRVKKNNGNITTIEQPKVVKTEIQPQAPPVENKISEEKFKFNLQKREKAAKKNDEISQVLTMVYTSANDILRQICIEPSTIETNVDLLKKLKNYSTSSMNIISERYNCVVPYITPNWSEMLKGKALQLNNIDLDD